MSVKVRAFLFNFLCFGALFILIRLGILYFFPSLPYLITFVITGSLAVILSPRFAAYNNDEGTEVLLMRWIFLKGIRQL
ncbi:hypothetical protein [Capnocytophaga gingivalis]|jgi:hypothetical protein|uniref:Uncharacterized protein n=1 Tax=Capnocytophaga gingivalis TaxID=1017 RepID=A0ABU5ZB04_9FLAO|nr:hypothetical protein [Capnocytophaga gingivalis]MEB3075322.1 hypothetical protein [Capnocytophaga gingivalis]